MREYFLATLAALCIVGDFVLLLAGEPIHPFMEAMTAAAVGGAAGVTVPRLSKDA
jgi:hypothetical protein